MITPEKLLESAKELETQLRTWRRTLHRHPEVGFDLPETKALVKKALTEMGYTPQDCGKCGVLALAGGKRPGKTILLRGDMDAHSGGIRRRICFRGAGQDARLRPRYAHRHDAGCGKAAQRTRGRDRGHHQAGIPACRGDFSGLAGHAEKRPAGKPEGGRCRDVPRSGRDAPAGGYGAGAGRRHHHGKLRAVPHHRPRQGRPRFHAQRLHRPHHCSGPHPHCPAGDQQP